MLFFSEVTALTDVSTKSLCSLPLSKTHGASDDSQRKADFIGFGSLGELFSEPFTIFPALFLALLVSFQGIVVAIGLEVSVTGEVSMDRDAPSTAAKFHLKVFPTAHQPGLKYPGVTHPSLGWVHTASEEARSGSHMNQRPRRFQSS